ncbi:basic salivary proline-rich protein 1-like [Manduca sexta]|uniref:basic salivary proline-rich protein 1-like n=1 Tax=Manduca sexta TaxID=7130 RepID=UPI00188FD132|nr:basic salivary proline-rich protein 1-like [Manduca sexta]
MKAMKEEKCHPKTTPRRPGGVRKQVIDGGDAGDGGSEGPSQAGVGLMGPAKAHLAHERRTATGDTQLPVTSGYVGGRRTQNRPKAREKGKRREQPPRSRSTPAPPPSQSLGPPARRHNRRGSLHGPGDYDGIDGKDPGPKERDAETKAPKGQEERTASSPTRSRAPRAAASPG